MHRKLLISFALAIGLFVVTAAGQKTEKPAGNSQKSNKGLNGERANSHSGKFDKLDLNHDGYISINEWRKNKKTFAQIDTNSDSQISRYEYQDYEMQNGGKGRPSGKP